MASHPLRTGTHPAIASAKVAWWQTRWFFIAAIIAAIVPLLWPPIPPFTDLLGHIGRYRVELDSATDPRLSTWYDFHWALIGNLGIDLLVVPLSKLFGLELAVKLIVMAIPALTVAALLAIAREVHGRVPATTLFALPLAYSYPLHYGFANFALSMALALAAMVAWLRLGRSNRICRRAAWFVPISCAIWLCHVYGWGLLGIMAFAAEWVRQRARQQGWIVIAAKAALGCAPLFLPIVLMAIWRSGAVAGGTGDWFDWPVKLLWLLSVLRDRWEVFDILSASVLFAIVLIALPSARYRFAPALGIAALLLALMFVLIPRILLGSAYADMRLAPYAFAVALIALRPIEGRDAPIAWMALAFCLIQLVATTTSLALYNARYQRELGALDHIPVGARLVSFVGFPCGGAWAATRLLHLPGIALERRRAYSNDQWSMAGAQLLTARYAAAGAFGVDPSEIVVADGCPSVFRQVSQALGAFPRGAFDYVWLIDPPAYRLEATRGLMPIWRYRSSVLLRVERGGAAPVK